MKDMVALLEELGLERIRERRDEVWASCPAHHDSGDSWSINKETGLHLCYACHYKGDLFGLIMQVTGMSVRQAQGLIDKNGIALLEPEEFEQLLETQPPVTPRFVPRLRYAEFGEVSDEMLATRHLDRSSADYYGLRLRDACTWILPIKTPGNTLLGWQEKGGLTTRTLPPGIVKGRTLFGAQHLGTDQTVVLVESPLDAVRLRKLGYLGIASMGAYVSDDQMRLLVQYASNLIVALDNDPAGVDGTWNLLMARQVTWIGKLYTNVVDYGERKVKDIGDMDDDDVCELLMDAPFVLDWMRETERPSGQSVYGNVVPLPRGGRAAYGRAQKAAGGAQYGARKNPLRDRSRRTPYR